MKVIEEKNLFRNPYFIRFIKEGGGVIKDNKII